MLTEAAGGHNSCELTMATPCTKDNISQQRFLILSPNIQDVFL